MYTGRFARVSPVVKAAATSCVAMGCGDIVCQSIQRRNKWSQTRYDWKRTARFSVVGLTLHGPFFFFGFRALDSFYGSKATFTNALVKTATGQVTLFPVYVSTFFAYMGLLEGQDATGCVQKVHTCFWPAVLPGTIFWPIVNVINFRLVPSTYRVLYINACGVVWNSFLSWTNSQSEPS